MGSEMCIRDRPEDGVEAIVDALNSLLGDNMEEEEVQTEDFEVMTLSLDLPGGNDDGTLALPELGEPGDFDAIKESDTAEKIASAKPGFRVVFRPLPELFASGNEPLFVLRSLTKLGSAKVTCHTEDVLELALYDPDVVKLYWTIDIATEAEQDIVTEVFDFVADLCHLDISSLEPAAAAALVEELGVEEKVEENLSDSTPTEEADLGSQAGTIPAAEDASFSTTPEMAEPAISAAPPAKTDKDSKAQKPAAQPMATVRVDLEKIDRLVNLVGELVINQAMLSQSVAGAGLPPNSPVAQGLEEFMRLTRDVQDSVMLIRAQPVKSLFQRMSRIVREASAAVGKDVRLVTVGETTEVDKTVIERLADPLTHMVRNAVDHGLESTDDRIASGKSPKGTVTLTAAHRSGRVIIDVQDDGGGINRPKVQEIAETRA